MHDAFTSINIVTTILSCFLISNWIEIVIFSGMSPTNGNSKNNDDEIFMIDITSRLALLYE